MESSEDDAGIATIASRRASAREKDVGQAEDVDATSKFHQESLEARTSCETPAMSEDNFDGDSVPSPSAQDVNTSTEAILDMIDEIVDGPGAPKRLPLASETTGTSGDRGATTSDYTDREQQPIKSDSEQSAPHPELALPVESAKSENESVGVFSASVECTLHHDASPRVKNCDGTVNSPQAISALCEGEANTVSEICDPNCAVSCVVPETSSVPPPNIPSSSVQTEQNASDNSDCEKLERTIKCVTSSENRDSVTVESAESTSSECNISESKIAPVEVQTRSPLRRRLVRPAPSDRRPDSTVSSTVDSQTIDIHITQNISENVTKDVSSSSDAVPTVHGNVKPEEIRNLSEISICKAETSVSPHKKIKLVRQKVTAAISNSNNTPIIIQPLSLEKEQCQSTSSDNLLALSEPCAESSSSYTTSKVRADNSKCVSDAEKLSFQNPEAAHFSQKNESKEEKPTETEKEYQHAIETPSPHCDDHKENEDHKVIPPVNVSLSSLESQTNDCRINNMEQEGYNTNSSNILTDEDKKVPPIKLNLSLTNSAQCNMNLNNCEPQSSSKNTIFISQTDEKDVSNLHALNISESTKCELNLIKTDNISDGNDSDLSQNQNKVPPITLNLTMPNIPELSTSETITANAEQQSHTCKSNIEDNSESMKQVPKLTIKLSSKQSEEVKSPVPKLTIKPLRPPEEKDPDKIDINKQIPCVTKINIKPIPKPSVKFNEFSLKPHADVNVNDTLQVNEHNIHSVTKLNIKPIPKPPEKINDMHRKSSSSEISESEYSENDESTTTSDQASASDQGSSDIIPKVTIKMGKPGTESEGKFYTEQNIPKLTIKGLQHSERDAQQSPTKLKLRISQSEDKYLDKIPKLTIKTVTSKSESQPLSPKLTIKQLKPPDVNKDTDNTSKMIKLPESFSSSAEIKENMHVPKITIKPITKTDPDVVTKTPKKLTVLSDSTEHIPVVTKLNIKPILKPTDSGETSECLDDKVPVVSKLNIKPIVKPKDIEVDSSVEVVPKIIKLNIKPLKNPEENSSEEKDCDEMNADIDENSIPVVTKLNIKPIAKPIDEETLKDSENQSSETGTSSDDNADHIPVVTKLNIKPILKPNDLEESSRSITSSEQTIPVITKLNIKPLLKPEESSSPSSPKKEHLKNPDLRCTGIPIVTKLNIKPVVKPEIAEKLVKNPPLLMKINMKTVSEPCNTADLSSNEHICNNLNETIPIIQKINIKSIIQSKTDNSRISTENQESEKAVDFKTDCLDKVMLQTMNAQSSMVTNPKHNCISENIEELISKDSMVVTKKQSDSLVATKLMSSDVLKENSLPESTEGTSEFLLKVSTLHDTKLNKSGANQSNEINDTNKILEHINAHVKAKSISDTSSDGIMTQVSVKQKSSIQNCTLLKKLLENTKDGLEKRQEEMKVNISNCILSETTESTLGIYKDASKKFDSENVNLQKVNSETMHRYEKRKSPEKINETGCLSGTVRYHPMQEIGKETNESLTKPLEINISEKITNQTSGQDSPRIILKINKTDHGPAAKIITEEIHRLADTLQEKYTDNTHELVNDKQTQKKQIINSRRKQTSDTTVTLSMGKRLRSSRVVENAEMSPILRRNTGKRPITTETSPPQSKETGLSILETKRLKLGQLLSVNKSLTITPVPVVSKVTQTSPNKPCVEKNQGVKSVNHSLLNNENCSKNGNSKLHNILSNLQAKQMQSIQLIDAKNLEKAHSVTPEVELNTSTGSSDILEITQVENCQAKVQDMIINEKSDFRDINTGPDPLLEISDDPLEVENSKTTSEGAKDTIKIPPVELTPQPRKRGRPRKLPVSEGAKPTSVTLPVSALEERPQRSLRLTRDRPAILSKPRGGRGRGRGRRVETSPPVETIIVVETAEDDLDVRTPAIDPTSSRIKLPRMTEALDNMPSVCSTPLSSRRRSSSGIDMKLFGETAELKVVLESSKLEDSFMKSPETTGSGRGRGGRGSRGGRGRTPRGRGRGRGGGRGAMYMKETMGIYGRVCGPATTTVQLFEEETCMMDDNATPAKPSHLLDEDSQSSVKSSTNDSNKMKKSKFADLFDSNKVWTAADVKEYTWPPHDKQSIEHQVMMIQEQVAMFLSVKSFKRRYPELKRRTIVGEERDFVLGKGLVTEALCDLGITAVDASEVLDIMLSDFPHKYEEYRSHQRQRQLNDNSEDKVDMKTEEKAAKVEMKMEKAIDKPEPPKIDPEKTRQDMAAAAIASASEWNARVNALRRPACVDLQSLTVHRRRAPAARPPSHVRPPAGFYPHALLPGQYQHSYRLYTPDQLRYFPLNTALSAPPAPPSPVESSSESEAEWGSSSSSDDSDARTHPAKRKKLTKVKRSSQAERASSSKELPEPRPAAPEPEPDTCRVCKLRLEANRKHTHERFLVCSNCNNKLHPSCVELSADTIRKCREYPWQCADCKSCGACRLPADDDKMLFCDLCDRGFHIYCVGLDTVPGGRWHCVECAVCKSCGAREPGGGAGPAAGPAAGSAAGPAAGSAAGTPAAAEWHHQTRRGPGGHKIYSHSLCTPCARAYRIGRYCPLCERSFIGPKGTMQLVICKLCDRQLHQECVRQTVSNLNVLDYTCGECRRGGITSRAAAVRLAPRTIATLFMAKRRFNKYAHRQYLQSRQRGLARSSLASENSNDNAEAGEPGEGGGARGAGERAERPDDASDGSEGEGVDPLEAAASVEALRMDFGD